MGDFLALLLLFQADGIEIIAVPSLTEQAAFSRCMEAEDEDVCLGIVTDACYDQPGSDTSEGIIACIQREYVLWDALVAERHSTLLQAYQDTGNILQDVEHAQLQDRLEASQSFWESLRDSDCSFLAAAYRIESLSRTAVMDCLRTRTAERAIWLGRQLAYAD